MQVYLTLYHHSSYHLGIAPPSYKYINYLKILFVYIIVRCHHKAVATRAEIYSRNDEANLTDVSCQVHVDVS